MLVVGAGPAGLAAAAELGRHGIDCVVIEPRATVSHDRPRAKTTNIRTMEHLRRWGAADALRTAAPLPVRWSQRVTFCVSLAGPRITDFDEAFGLFRQRDERFAEPGQQVPQPVVEEMLRAHVRRLPSVDLRLGQCVSALTQDDDGVTVSVTDSRAALYTIRARWVLGCDGSAGVVRKQMGARYVGRSDPRSNFNVVFRAPLLNPQLGPAVQYWVLGTAMTGLIGRLDLNGTWWAIFPGVDPAHGAQHASELITELVGAPVDHEVLATDPWTARMLIADTFRDRRVFLVGESAHLNPPWGGHGFNTCIGDAVNIGWKIAAVAKGWAAPELLDSYEPERRQVVTQTVASAELNLRSLAGDLPRDEAAIRAVKSSEFYSLGLVLGYTYAGSPVIQEADTPVMDTMHYTPTTRPGSRLPHTWLPDGTSLYDHLGAGFTLLGPASDRTDVLVARAAERGIPLKLLKTPLSYPWHDEFLLVRPDQHIAWQATDPTEINIEMAAGHLPKEKPCVSPPSITASA